MRRTVLWMAMVAVVVIGAATATSPAHSADLTTKRCTDTVNFAYAGMQCTLSAKDVKSRLGGDDSHTYSLIELCENAADKPGGNGVCGLEGKPCGKGNKGTQWNFLQDRKYFGTTCLMPADLKDLKRITPAMVLVEFRKLSWPSGQLVVQPSRGWTLVNAPTVVSTTTAGTQSQSVTLLGQNVEIQAWPRYTWVFGDGSSTTTDGPGRRVVARRGQSIQDVNLSGAIVHRYDQDGDVQVRLDLTYSGRYRIGRGQWIDIPGTLTVSGKPQPLRVEDARPELTG